MFFQKFFTKTGPPQAQPSGVIFAVDAVTPAAKPICTQPLLESLSYRFLRRVLALPDAQQPVINYVFDSCPPALREMCTIKNVGSRNHALIDAVHVAFAQHRPLSLSPDTIWLVIAQGFSQHVSANADTLRHTLVNHEGKRTLTSDCRNLSLESFQGSIDHFSEQIREATNPVLYDALICDFSTTTPVIRTTSEVVLMNCYSSYFDYELACVCGIPSIMLRGTPEDWRRIRARVEVFATYELEWWVKRLRPILDEFIATAEGNPSDSFWKAIYKPAKAYATTVATGWITDLFPYLGDPPEQRRNHALERPRKDWAIHAGKFGDGAVALESYPSGLASVPLKIKLPDHSESTIDLVAGFLGVTQDKRDFTLSPLLSWCVAETPKRVLVHG